MLTIICGQNQINRVFYTYYFSDANSNDFVTLRINALTMFIFSEQREKIWDSETKNWSPCTWTTSGIINILYIMSLLKSKWFNVNLNTNQFSLINYGQMTNHHISHWERDRKRTVDKLRPLQFTMNERKERARDSLESTYDNIAD